METSDAVTSALKPGELTSEHAAMVTASKTGAIFTYIGIAVAGLPQILDMLNMLPPQVLASKYPQVILAVLGCLSTIFGLVRETAAKVAYITGRSQLKAATVLNTVQPAPIAPANVPPAR